MKKFGNFKILVSLGIASLLCGSLIGPANAGIAGSAHDFSADIWSGGEICKPCHTPHNADETATGAPLWNHDVTTETFVMYSSATLNGTIDTEPSGVSKLCLSCHDGVTAIDAFGANTPTPVLMGSVNPNADFGTNLSNDHPISIVYDDVADGGLHPPTDVSNLGGDIATDLLFGGRVECASCHDVHNDAGNAYLLRMPNTASALCLTCHTK